MLLAVGFPYSISNNPHGIAHRTEDRADGQETTQVVVLLLQREMFFVHKHLYFCLLLLV